MEDARCNYRPTVDLDAVAEAALSYVGTKFHHQARLPGVGMDCVGVVALSGAAGGAEVRDFTAYGRNPNPRELMRRVRENFDEIELADARCGDVPVFWMKAPDVPQHLGVFAPHPNGHRGIVHAHDDLDGRRGTKRVVLVGFPGFWEERLDSVWRWRGAV